MIEPHFDLIGIFIVVFDLTNRTSFDNTTKWVSKLRALGVNVKGYLIGNKNDVNQDRQVITDKEAQKLATQLGLKYHKVKRYLNYLTRSIRFSDFSEREYWNYGVIHRNVYQCLQ